MNLLKEEHDNMIDFRTFPEIMKAAKEYSKLVAKSYASEMQSKSKWDAALEAESAYLNNVYAPLVYETLRTINPTVVDSYNAGKRLTFLEAFGSWEDVVERQMQVVYELVEDGYGPFQLEQKVITVNGTIKDKLKIMNPETRIRDIILPREP